MHDLKQGRSKLKLTFVENNLKYISFLDLIYMYFFMAKQPLFDHNSCTGLFFESPHISTKKKVTDY